MHRSALPVAVRTSLNSVAFHVKQRTMLAESQKQFTNRNKTFFKANSRVKQAKGFKISTMNSTVGFVGAKQNQAVDDLEKQERGGTIGGRAFIPIDTGRVGNSNNKNVRKANRLRSKRNPGGINIRAIDKIQSKKSFFKGVAKAGIGGHIIYKGTLFKVKKIQRGKIKLLPLFSVEKNRKVRVSNTFFMKRSSLMSMKKMDSFFIKEAQKQIKRLR